jgi:hypothetical protein
MLVLLLLLLFPFGAIDPSFVALKVCKKVDGKLEEMDAELRELACGCCITVDGDEGDEYDC